MILEHRLGLGATVAEVTHHNVLVDHHDAAGEARVVADVLLVVTQAVGAAHERYREVTELLPGLAGEEDGTNAVAHGANRVRKALGAEALSKSVNVAEHGLGLTPHIAGDLGLADYLAVVVKAVTELNVC